MRFKNRRTIVAKKLLLCEIIEARVEHILEEVLRSLRTRYLLGCLFGGIVLSGGSSLLEGIREKTQSMMHRDTHIGYPNGVVGLEEIITSPSMPMRLVYSIMGLNDGISIRNFMELESSA